MLSDDYAFFVALARARSFLPAMADANQKLKTEMLTFPEGTFDIENVDNCKGPVIEMVSHSWHPSLQGILHKKIEGLNSLKIDIGRPRVCPYTCSMYLEASLIDFQAPSGTK